jgi:hypothetical protein
MKTTTLFKSALFAALLALASAQVTAQELPEVFGKTVKSVNPANGLLRCATPEYEAYLNEQDPKRETTEQFEQWLSGKMQQKQAQRSTPVTGVITIPVVVHVIHNGDAVGSSENISDAQVISQITVLNQDYRRMADTPGYNEFAVGADMEIQFVLAQTDPDGNLTTGIDRVQTTKASWANETLIDSELKPTTSWDPSKYFNIWVVNFGNSSVLLGYAQFPAGSTLGGLGGASASASTDGVVIGYPYFGSANLAPNGNYGGSGNPYRYGRTATHEVGHWLGLRHISGDNASCSVNAIDSSNDYCPDTPATNDYNYECGIVDSCPLAPGNDMIENYMDYTYDSCMNVFTQNQKNRMRTVMQNAINREALLTSTVANAPTAGTAQFSVLNGLSVYPNPTQGILTISNNAVTLPDSYTIYNSLGQTVYSTKVTTANNLTINTAAYSNGVYFIKVNAGNQSRTLKFIKN